MKGRFVLAALGAAPIALLAAGPAMAQSDEMTKYISTPASSYKNKISVSNASNGKTVVSSASAWSDGGETDAYLGATIDKATKAVKYFAYQTQQVVGDWAGYSSAHVAAPSGAMDIKVTYKNDKVQGCDATSGECTMQEVAGFPVDRALLDQYAAKAPATGDKLSWALISSKGAHDAPATLSVGEIKAFLDAVDTQMKK